MHLSQSRPHLRFLSFTQNTWCFQPERLRSHRHAPISVAMIEAASSAARCLLFSPEFGPTIRCPRRDAGAHTICRSCPDRRDLGLRRPRVFHCPADVGPLAPDPGIVAAIPPLAVGLDDGAEMPVAAWSDHIEAKTSGRRWRNVRPPFGSLIVSEFRFAQRPFERRKRWKSACR
jgi:hypothetical protein